MAEGEVNSGTAIGESVRQHFQDLAELLTRLEQVIANITGGTVDLGPISAKLDTIGNQIGQVLANQNAHTALLQQVVDQFGETPASVSNAAFVPPPQPRQ